MNITTLASQLYNIFFTQSRSESHRQKSNVYFGYLQTFRNLYVDNKVDTAPLMRLTWLIYMHSKYLERFEAYTPATPYYELIRLDLDAVDREIIQTLANCNKYLSDATN